MKRADELRQQAERYRRLERHVSDAAAIKAISELSEELEMTAAALAKHHRIRERAHEIWLEHRCPAGRDVEHGPCHMASLCRFAALNRLQQVRDAIFPSRGGVKPYMS